MNFSKLKIAIVCDWLTTPGGAVKVIHSIHTLFPQAPIYTTLFDPVRNKHFTEANIRTSYLQKLRFKKHQILLPFMPSIFENFNLDEFDIVISSSHSCAKGIITRPSTLHICYCHSPMRYAWEDSINYINAYSTNLLVKKIAPLFLHKIRLWDRLSADRVDYFIANSRHVQQRILKYYRRPSTVIHPFVNMGQFNPGKERGDYYLAVGRLTNYKKFDLLIETFNELGYRLKIAGTGSHEKKLKKMAKNNFNFLGYVDDDRLAELYGNARALIFPQQEDFGIIPLEAMAAGCPVIAYAGGGALETVVDGESGIFFHEQTPASLKKAISNFEKKNFDPQKIRLHAEKFNEKVLSFIVE